ncbi:MAG TPA: alpha/beta fold hydrolase, partial [Longimicrobiales bacterium]
GAGAGRREQAALPRRRRRLAATAPCAAGLLARVALAGVMMPAALRAQAPAPDDATVDPPLASFSYGTQGTPVVIVTGVLGSAYSYRKVVPELVARDFRVTIIDPLGFGASPRPDGADYSSGAQANRVAAVMERKAGGPALLVCHALAGPICLRLAYRRPDLVRAVVSINGGASEQAGTAQMRMALKFARIVLAIAGRGFAIRKLKGGLIDSSGDPSWVTDDVVAHYVAPFGSDPRQVIASLQQILGAREAEPLRPNLRRVRVPVLLLYGPRTHDPNQPALSLEERQLMRAELPHFQQEDVTGAGTYIQEEQPGQVVAAVVRMRDQIR